MKSLLSLLALSLLSAANLFAQGNIFPTTAPNVPIMKTLDQIEARTPIPATGPFPFTISTSGSYFLTGNVSVSSGNAIVIAASDVTLDLNGFTIASTSATASGEAITFSGVRARVAISNGHIRSGVTYSGGSFTAGPGFEAGIHYPPGSEPSGVRVTGISVTGTRFYGIDVGNDDSSIVQGCTVRTSQNSGIRAGVVSDCSSTNAGGDSITAARVANSVGSTANGIGNGINTTGPTLGDNRTPISGSIDITQSGSYYLTGNIAVTGGDAITISTSNVTVDLNGFTISSDANPNSGTGVTVSGIGLKNIAIRNGGIAGSVTFDGSVFSGPGFLSGINAQANGVLVERIRVTGVARSGIVLNVEAGCVARDCVTSTTGYFGITADTVTGCTVTTAGRTAILAHTVTNSTAVSVATTGPYYGIKAEVVEACYALGRSGIGADAGTVSNSYGEGRAGIGIEGLVAINSSANNFSSTAAAISVTRAATNCYGLALNGGDGISALTGVVTNCFGESLVGAGVGLRALTANGSRGEKSGAVSQVITNKYNMP